jgi:hypothetical protein
MGKLNFAENSYEIVLSKTKFPYSQIGSYSNFESIVYKKIKLI